MNLLSRQTVKRIVGVAALSVFATGCAVNPVTGRRELQFVSERSEIALGANSYAPAQQSQNGPYVVDPGVTTYVKEIGERLAKQSDRPNLPYDFVVLNNSVPNAWAMPGGKIAVNRGLLTELDSEAELAAVIGHEIVHAAARHGAQQYERGILTQVGVVAVGVASSGKDYASQAVGAAMLGAQLATARYSRSAESESDFYGMKYMAAAGYDPRAAIGLQETFVRLSKEKGKQTDWMQGLFASHPPSQQRVAANRRTALQFAAGGAIRPQTYKRKLATIFRAKPAYDALAEGEKAMGAKDYDAAIAAADKAIGIESREADFYALRGKAKELKGQRDAAMRDYDRAVRLNDRFYQYPLFRGLLRKEMGDAAAAKPDLELSLKLFETAPAHLALGQIAEAGGDRRTAAAHYKAAAPANSLEGAAARARFTALTGIQLVQPQQRRTTPTKSPQSRR